jgi:transcriptional regulator with XRE-family HTH domain
MGLGARIAELRRATGESLQDVADAVGVTKTHIWELERGRTSNPSVSVIKGLADHFKVSIASLVDEDIDAQDTNQQLARMFRQAGEIDPADLQVLDDMIQSFRKRKRSGASA